MIEYQVSINGSLSLITTGVVGIVTYTLNAKLSLHHNFGHSVTSIYTAKITTHYLNPPHRQTAFVGRSLGLVTRNEHAPGIFQVGAKGVT